MQRDHKGFCQIIGLGLLYKWRVITPFTTDHSRLSRAARGIINVAVLMTLWAFTGFVIDIGSNLDKAAYMPIALICAAILGRILTISLELLMAKTKSKILKVLKMILGISVVLTMTGAVMFFTLHMDDEFWWWGLATFIFFVMELFAWEALSLFVQAIILKKLQGDEEV